MTQGKTLCLQAQPYRQEHAGYPQVRHPGGKLYTVVTFWNQRNTVSGWTDTLAQYAAAAKKPELVQLWEDARVLNEQKFVDRMYELALKHGRRTKHDSGSDWSTSTYEFSHQVSAGSCVVVYDSGRWGDDSITIKLKEWPVFRCSTNAKGVLPTVGEKSRYKLTIYETGPWKWGLSEVERKLNAPLTEAQQQRAKALDIL